MSDSAIDDIDVPALTDLIHLALQDKGLCLVEARDLPNKYRGRVDLETHMECELAAGIIRRFNGDDE